MITKPTMTAWEMLVLLNESVYGFYSTEAPMKKVSKSEMKRWFQKKSVWIGGKAVDMNDEFDTSIQVEMILHPKSNRRYTFLWFEG